MTERKIEFNQQVMSKIKENIIYLIDFALWVAIAGHNFKWWQTKMIYFVVLRGILLTLFEPEFTVVISIHYKPRIAVAILDLYWMKMIWCGLKIEENCYVLINQFRENFRSETLDCRKTKSVFRDVKWCLNASWGLKGLNTKQYIPVRRRQKCVLKRSLRVTWI